MDEKERVEILKELVEYLPLLVETSEEVCKEFKGAQEEDTKDLFNQVIDGINWTLGVYEEIGDTLKEIPMICQNDELEAIVEEFVKSIEEKEEEKIAEIMENGILPFLREFCTVAKEELEKE